LRKPIVAGNWKMNGNLFRVKALAGEIVRGLSVNPVRECEVVLLPTFVHLTTANRLASGTDIAIGSQDLDERNEGAVTGGISASILKDAGCSFALCGHSERRTLFAENDNQVASKFAAAIDAGLIPILCLGETLAQRERGKTADVVFAQLDAVLERVGFKGFSRAVLAYEPIWAIGTGQSATPEQVEEVHASLRERLAKGSSEVAESIRILYGGSVRVDNALRLFANENVDGGLIGGAALDSESFLKICHKADATVC